MLPGHRYYIDEILRSLEFCEMGTLHSRMNDPNVKIEWKDVIHYSQDIAKGVYFLHSWKPPVVHRDIKSSNMLLDRMGTIKVKKIPTNI